MINIKQITDPATYQKVKEDQSKAENFGKWISTAIETVRFEIKIIKKILGEYTEDRHWIEFMDRDGGAGWLYNDVSYFAFETEGYWILVDRVKLQTFIEALVDQNKWNKIGERQPYKLTKIFHGRQDVAVLVKSLDLAAHSFAMVPKEVS